MLLAALLGCFSFILALILTPFIRDYFIRIGLVDKPDQVRKFHIRPIPRVGGIGILAAYLLSFGILSLYPFADWHFLQDRAASMGAMLAGALVIFLAGLVDDFLNIRPWQKLSAQILAATIIYFSGIRIFIARGTTYEEPLSFLVTVIWLVCCTNAFNLIDGLDGLASGVGLFATITILIAGITHNNMDLLITTLPLAGALLGFLRYNFNPASIFLGDCGSMLIGFVLGCFAIEWSHKSATLLGLTAPMMAFAVPLIDVLLSVSRRFLRSRPVFGADRGHIHHRLLDRGLTQRQATLVAYGFSCLAATFSLIQNSLHHHYGGLIIVLFCLTVWIGIQNLGYVEFGMASRMLLGGGVGRMIDFETKLKLFEAEMKTANSLDRVWALVAKSSHDFGFHGTRLSLFGKVNEEIEAGYLDSMQIRIPLAHGNYINFYGVDGRILSLDLNSFLPVVTNSLNLKIEEYLPHMAVSKKEPASSNKPKLIKLA
jgi:UDP-GlcNAc:undecaprenyl-phosphate GlcNAc-1-phosphate transferase